MRAPIILLVLGGVVTLAGLLQGSSTAGEKKLRIGVYDSRAIAIAYAPSKHNPVAQKMKELQAAKAEGDEARIAELEGWGEKHQRQLHRQGFGRVPVDDLLAHVAERLPEVARAAGVDAIAFDCSWSSEEVEIVDVTMEIVKLYDPSEKTLGFVAQIKEHEPVDLDELAQHDH